MSKKALGKGLGAIFGEDLRGGADNIGKNSSRNTGDKYIELSIKDGEASEISADKESVSGGLSSAYYSEGFEQGGTGESGSGYGALKSGDDSEGKIKSIRLSLIEPNRNQPRKSFDEEALRELASSMEKFGVLQPLLVKKNGEMYELIAGERRWRAAKLAGIKEIPVIIKELEDKEAAEIAIIENIQREDLSPLEEAKAYRSLISEYGLTQEEVAERVSKNRSTITNSLRLLNLDERVQELLSVGKLSAGHARTLITIGDMDRQYELAFMIYEKGLSVRETESLVKKEAKKKEGDLKKEHKKDNEEIKLYLDELSARLTGSIGTKVQIKPSSKNRGKIQIEYYSSEDLEKIIDLLGK